MSGRGWVREILFAQAQIMPQTICSKCLAQLPARQRREGKMLCDACEAQWSSKLPEALRTRVEPAAVPPQRGKQTAPRGT